MFVLDAYSTADKSMWPQRESFLKSFAQTANLEEKTTSGPFSDSFHPISCLSMTLQNGL